MLSVVKMLLKGEVGGHALNSHGNYIVDLTWKIGKIMELCFEFLWEPCHVFILMFSCRSKYYRQNLIFSDVSVPEITALFNKHCHSILYRDFMRLSNLYRSIYVHLFFYNFNCIKFLLSDWLMG